MSRITALLDHWISEGFFASVVVLVEGDTDRAAILGAGKANKHDLDSLGISVLACNGKSGIITAAAIFRAFDTPTFCIWDSDEHLGETAGRCEKCEQPLDSKKGVPKENRSLLQLVGKVEEDWPEHIDKTSACFKHNLESTLKNEIGEESFEQFLDTARIAFGISKRRQVLKNSMAISLVLERAKAAGKSSKSLDSILRGILALRESTIVGNLQ